MKKIFIILLIAALGLVSCENYLNTEPIDKISIKQYFTDELGLTQALAGVYDPLGGEPLYGSVIFSKINVCTDEGFFARTSMTSGIEVNNYDITNADVNNLWASCYTGINRANDLIANINLPQMDETKRQIILGEALFLRGYYHFLLVTNFENIPLMLAPTTSPDDVFVSQATPKAVYDQILKDMIEAEGKVATSTSLGYSSRISKTAVQGILARVCLYMAGYPLNETAKYSEALAWAKKVESSGEHALNTTFNPALSEAVFFTNNGYSQIFINHIQDIYNVKESIWEIDFKGNRRDGGLETGRLGNLNGITFTTEVFPIGYSYGFVRGTARLYKSFGEGDLRRDWVLTPFTYSNATGKKTKITTTTGYGRDAAKWRREFELLSPKDKNATPTNFPVLRYADVLLMMAEAENQVNGPTPTAYEAINKVRRRGYGLNIATASNVADLPAGLSKDAFQLAIEKERMLELCFEGTRRFDLIRWNKYVSTLNSIGNEIGNGGGNQAYGGLGGKNTTEKHIFYPIPSREISVNTKLVQNPLWK
jgi:hypothetical protein